MTPPWSFKKPWVAARTSQKWSGNGMGAGGNHSGMLASEALRGLPPQVPRPRTGWYGQPCCQQVEGRCHLRGEVLGDAVGAKPGERRPSCKGEVGEGERRPVPYFLRMCGEDAMRRRDVTARIRFVVRIDGIDQPLRPGHQKLPVSSRPPCGIHDSDTIPAPRPPAGWSEK